MKPTTPSGTLPVLEVDGKSEAGSGPIARFLGERFGLAGSNDFENLQLACICDVLSDLLTNLSVWFREKDEKRKADLKEAMSKEHIPKYVGLLEKKCTENKSDGDWIYGEKPTYVDFAIYTYLDLLSKLFPGFLESYPAINKMRAAVESLPNIAAWIKARPPTDH